MDFFISFFNSFSEPIHISSEPFSVLQIGNGIPQNLDLDKFQSFTFSNHLPNLPSPVDFGFQFIEVFNSTIESLIFEVLINQESTG